MSATAPAGNSARRRGASKGDAREADILRTFETLLAERPFPSICVDDLAAGAGISRSAFYFYFSSKDAVLTALVDGLESSLVAENADWYQGTGDAEAALRRSAEHSLRLWSQRYALLRLAYFGVDVPPPVLAFRERSLRRQQRGTLERIERERAAGRAPAGSPSSAALAAALIAVRTGLLSQAFAPTNDPTSDPAPGSTNNSTKTVDREHLVDDLVALQLRLLYGSVTST